MRPCQLHSLAKLGPPVRVKAHVHKTFWQNHLPHLVGVCGVHIMVIETSQIAVIAPTDLCLYFLITIMDDNVIYFSFLSLYFDTGFRRTIDYKKIYAVWYRLLRKNCGPQSKLLLG